MQCSLHSVHKACRNVCGYLAPEGLCNWKKVLHQLLAVLPSTTLVLAFALPYPQCITLGSKCKADIFHSELQHQLHPFPSPGYPRNHSLWPIHTLWKRINFLHDISTDTYKPYNMVLYNVVAYRLVSINGCLPTRALWFIGSSSDLLITEKEFWNRTSLVAILPSLLFQDLC